MKRQSKRGVSLGHTLVKCNVNRHLKKKKVCVYICVWIFIRHAPRSYSRGLVYGHYLALAC